MMCECFTDCKMLIIFCYILSLAHCKGTATGTLEIQPTMTSADRSAIVRRMLSLADVGRCSCPQSASAHPSPAAVFSQSTPQRCHTTASESTEVHAEENDGDSHSNTGAAEPRNTS